MMETVIGFLIALTALVFVLGFISYLNGGGSKVYVALLISDHDELQDTKVVKVIGVFRKKETAEAKLYNYSNKHDFGQQTSVVECTINKDEYSESKL